MRIRCSQAFRLLSKRKENKPRPKRVIARRRRRQKPWQSPGYHRIPTPNRTDQSQPLYQLSQILIFVLLLRLYNFEFVFTVVKSTMLSYEKPAMSSYCTLHHLWLVTVTCKERKSTPMITSACATALAGLKSTKQSSSGSVRLHGAHFRGWNKYAGTYPRK